MTSKLKVLILAAFMTLPFVANAQPAAHDWEIILGGTGQATSDFRAPAAGTAGGTFGASLSLGYYLNDNLEAAVRQFVGYQTSGAFAGSTRLALDYNIMMDKLVPFIGVNAGYAYGNKNQLDSWIFSPEAGFKYYLQSKAFLFGMGEYQIPTRGRDAIGNGNWVFTLGIGLNM
jgi:hypothetical protein